MAKAAPHHVVKTLQGWQPVSAAAREFHAKTKLGQVVEVRERRPRNPGHHRKFFSLLNLLVENTEDFANTDDALVGVKAVMGRGEWKRLHPKSQREVFMPESIAFDAMGQDEFEVFYEAALAAVRRWWLPVEDADLRQAIEEYAA